MDEKEKGFNIGCIVFVVILVLGVFVYNVATSSKGELARGGRIVIGLGVLAVAGYIINEWPNIKKTETVSKIYNYFKDDDDDWETDRRAKEKDDFSWKGCLGIVVGLFLLGLVINVLTSFTELNVAVGVLFCAAAAVATGLLIYYITKG